MDLIQHNQVDKVSKLLERGFDPNYHDSETGGKAQSTNTKHFKHTHTSDLKLHQGILPNRNLHS